MKSPKTFSERVNKEIMPMIDFPKDSKEYKELEERLFADLIGERLPDDHLPVGHITPKQIYFKEVFNRYFEITESLERMKMTQKFISNMSKTKTISRLEYFKYHYEYYLNELYIFKLRINRLLDYVIKKCKIGGLHDEERRVEILKKQINNAMASLIRIRGLHVHDRRYKNSKLEQLQVLDLLSSNFDFIHTYRDFELKNLQKKTSHEIKGNIDALTDFFENTIYKDIGTLIFIKLVPSPSPAANS